MEDFKRVTIPHGSARVRKDCCQGTTDALISLSEAAYKTADRIERFGKAAEPVTCQCDTEVLAEGSNECLVCNKPLIQWKP